MRVCTILGMLLAAVNYAKSTPAKSVRYKHEIPPPYRLLSQINTTAAGLFNSATEKCCLGSVHPNKKPSYDKCCGSGMMESSKQLCCNDVIVPLVPGESCCGQKTINTDNAICCDNEEAKIDPKVIPFAKCCGKKAYDGRTQTCCSARTEFNVFDGTNLRCCLDKAYEYGKQVCCVDDTIKPLPYRIVSTTDVRKTHCCGNTVYDPVVEFCCGGKVVALNRDCCAGKDFDPTTHACCNNQLTERNEKDLKCCGGIFYDSAAEFCCNNNILAPLLVPRPPSLNPNQSACCGMEPYDTVNQICCEETKKILNKTTPGDYRCCGNVSFGYLNGFCCDDILYTNGNDITHECCGGKPMTRSKNTCCGNVMIPVSRGDNCCGKSEVYDSATQLCCSALDANNTKYSYSVVEKKGQKAACCGLKAYDIQKEMCCGRLQVVPISGNTKCCGSQSYNPDKEVCCIDTSVFPKENGRDACCLYGMTDAVPECLDYPLT